MNLIVIPLLNNGKHRSESGRGKCERQARGLSRRNGLRVKPDSEAVLLPRWPRLAEAALLYSPCKALTSSGLPVVSFKENRTNWNVLRCYIVVASCLSDSG